MLPPSPLNCVPHSVWLKLRVPQTASKRYAHSLPQSCCPLPVINDRSLKPAHVQRQWIYKNRSVNLFIKADNVII